MTTSTISNWQDLQAEILHRIHSRHWKPGELIPNEVDLADEFGCARATVNRALRAVAEAGLIERRRKAGTRVAVHPVRKATLSIPIIRHQIEERGQAYGYTLIRCVNVAPPPDIRDKMALGKAAKALHVRALHLADGAPFVYEDRWINPAAVPQIRSVDLSSESANEWLVVNAPFTDGDIAFSAAPADAVAAEVLEIEPGAAVFTVERSTWDQACAITFVRLTFAPGYRMHTTL